MKKAILLFSGGLDSTTVMAMALNDGYELYAISFDYKQRHNVELAQARIIAAHYGVKHKIIDIDLRNFGGSCLTSDADVPKYNDISELPTELTSTFVPARNTIFLSYALALAQVEGTYEIFTGMNQLDYGNYPDCREEYVQAYEHMANLSIGSYNEKKIKIHIPIINYNKKEIIKAGLNLGVDYSRTISCYDPTDDGFSCGSCLSCMHRKNAFAELKIPDPTKYITK